MARTSAEDREAAKTAARRRLKARALPKIEALIARSEADGEARVGKFYRWVLTELRDKDEVYPYVAAEHMWCFPVTVEEFIQSKDFAGAMEDARVWPAWQKELRRMTPDVMCGEAPVDEVILGGASGTGKTWVSILSLLYRLYMLSCFRTPQVLWGMAPTTHMLVPLTSHNRDHRQKMLYLPLRRLVEATPFFKRFVPWDKEKDSELYFTNLNVSVKPVTPVAGSLTGSQVFGGILDEMSSMSIVEESKRTLGADGRGGRFDQAEEMYDEVTSRMGRNFTGLGLAVPCVYVLSQTKYTDDFVDKLLARAVKDPRPSVYSRRLMRHQVKPEDVADMARGSTIKVLVGAPGYASRLLEGDEVDRVSSEARIMEVPARYRNQFYDNPDGGLRDVCGISTGVINPFVPNRSAVGEAFRRGERLRPWVNAQNVVLSTDGMPRWVEENMPEDRDAPRFIHVDLSRSKDRCGVAVVKVDGMQHVHDEEFGVVERAPHITVEVAVTIKPSGTHQIDPGDVRSWLMELGTRYGINIGGVSYDGFDSHESIMRWRGAGVRNVREISMDRTTEAYEGLRRALYSGRVDLVENDVLRTEIIELEYNSAKDKVDHPPRGCFTAETRVALLDGTLPTMSELVERYGTGGEFYVYSIGPEGVQGARAVNPRVTKTVNEVCEVTLDNFQVVRCTPDHLFMTLDGGWVQAGNLTPDVRIMPLYRSIGVKGGAAGYERVWCPVRRRRLPTHHLVAGTPEHGHVVHHKDEDKANNSPGNLEHLARGRHHSLHAVEAWGNRRSAMREGHRRYYEDPDKRIMQRDRMLAAWAEGKFRAPRGECVVQGCGRAHNARGLCDMHYQGMKRAGTLPELRTSNQQNHRVLSVRMMRFSGPVYDITVPGTENFALASGVFVHNSKDLADAVAGAMKNASEARGVRGQAGYVDSDTGERVKVRRARDNKERPQGRRTRRVGLQDRVDRMARGEPDPWDLK